MGRSGREKVSLDRQILNDFSGLASLERRCVNSTTAEAGTKGNREGFAFAFPACPKLTRLLENSEGRRLGKLRLRSKSPGPEALWRKHSPQMRKTRPADMDHSAMAEWGEGGEGRRGINGNEKVQ